MNQTKTCATIEHVQTRRALNALNNLASQLCFICAFTRAPSMLLIQYIAEPDTLLVLVNLWKLNYS